MAESKNNKENQDQKPSRKLWKWIALLILLVIIIPSLWWKFFGVKRIYTDGLPHMTNEQLKEHLSPEAYESWMKMHGSKNK